MKSDGDYDDVLYGFGIDQSVHLGILCDLPSCQYDK